MAHNELTLNNAKAVHPMDDSLSVYVNSMQFDVENGQVRIVVMGSETNRQGNIAGSILECPVHTARQIAAAFTETCNEAEAEMQTTVDDLSGRVETLQAEKQSLLNELEEKRNRGLLTGLFRRFKSRKSKEIGEKPTEQY